MSTLLLLYPIPNHEIISRLPHKVVPKIPKELNTSGLSHLAQIVVIIDKGVALTWFYTTLISFEPVVTEIHTLGAEEEYTLTCHTPIGPGDHVIT